VCDGELELFLDAPEPISSSEPFDHGDEVCHGEEGHECTD